MTSPEQIARKQIDQMLVQAGWQVQDLKDINTGAALGVAVREYPTSTGPADYILFVDRNPAGVIEAKKDGTILTNVEDQTHRYATSKLKWNVISDELSLNKVKLKDDKPKEVAYNPAVPVEHFDFIIIDECHRSIYN